MLGCTGSSDEVRDNISSIEGTWLSECVAENLSPFPIYSTSTDTHVIMQLKYENGKIIATQYLHSDLLCESLISEFNIFEGEYSLGEVVATNNNYPITEIDMVGIHPLGFFAISYETYYLIEDGILYMNDTLSSEVSINRNVPFTK